MTCKHDVKRVTIDPSLLADDKDMLEDLVAAAFNAAVRKAEETSAGEDGQAHRRHAGPAARHEVAVLKRPLDARAPWLIQSRSTALIEALRRLPGVGVKSASRMAFHLLQHDREGAQLLARALQQAAHAGAALRALPHLHRSGGLQHLPRPAARRHASCAWSRRRPTRPRWSAPAPSAGCYFVLMGKLSPLDGIGPNDIGLQQAVRPRHRRRRCRK